MPYFTENPEMDKNPEITQNAENGQKLVIKVVEISTLRHSKCQKRQNSHRPAVWPSVLVNKTRNFADFGVFWCFLRVIEILLRSRP